MSSVTQTSRMQSVLAVQNPWISKSPCSSSPVAVSFFVDTLVGKFGGGSLYILIGATMDEGFVA